MEVLQRKVGNRRRLSDLDTHSGRLVIGTVTQADAEALKQLMSEMAHKTKAGGLRAALRRLYDTPRLPGHEEMLITIRRESLIGTNEHKNLMSSPVRMPCYLEQQDSDRIEELLVRWDLSSFAQVVRLSLRLKP